MKMGKFIRQFCLPAVLTAAGFLTVSSNVAYSQQLSSAVGLLKGDVTTRDGKPIQGVNVWIIKGTDRVNTTRTNTDGHFTSVLQPNATYRVALSSTEYGYREDTITIPALSAYKEFTIHSTLVAIRNGEPFDLSRPVFQPRSATIDAASIGQLDEIVEMMRHNPKMTVNVTVYPDMAIGGKKDKNGAAQMKLVDSRAAAVRSYFMSHNISAKNVNVFTATTVPQGRFASSAQQSSEDNRKQKKHGAESAKPGLVPQYIEIVPRIAS